MKSLLSDLVAEVFAGNETLGVIAVVLGVAVALIGSLLKVWSGWRVGGIVLSTKREELYLKMLDQGVEKANAHRLELAFLRARRYRLTSIDIRFAAMRENAERHMRALRHGLMLVRREGECYVLKKPTQRMWVRELIAYLSCCIGAVGAVIVFLGALLDKTPGLALIGIELVFMVWLGADILRANACAQWLLDPANYPLSPAPKAKRSSKKPKDPPTLERVA